MPIRGRHVQRCVPVFRCHVDATFCFAKDPETLFSPVLTGHVHWCSACSKIEKKRRASCTTAGGVLPAA